MTKNIRKLERMIASIKKIASDGPEAVTPEERLSAMEFVDVFVVQAFYKRVEIQKWSEQNKGKSLLHMVTMASVSYSLMILKSEWDCFHEQSKVPKEEKMKYSSHSNARVSEQTVHANAFPFRLCTN